MDCVLRSHRTPRHCMNTVVHNPEGTSHKVGTLHVQSTRICINLLLNICKGHFNWNFESKDILRFNN